MSVCGCGDAWARPLAQLCSDDPGTIHECPHGPTLCPPEDGCDDVIVHRTPHRPDWHTSEGWTPEQWWATHARQGALQ